MLNCSQESRIINLNFVSTVGFEMQPKISFPRKSVTCHSTVNKKQNLSDLKCFLFLKYLFFVEPKKTKTDNWKPNIYRWRSLNKIIMDSISDSFETHKKVIPFQKQNTYWSCQHFTTDSYLFPFFFLFSLFSFSFFFLFSLFIFPPEAKAPFVLAVSSKRAPPSHLWKSI